MIQFLHLREIPKRMSVKMKTIGKKERKKERKKGCCGVHTYNCMKPYTRVYDMFRVLRPLKP